MIFTNLEILHQYQYCNIFCEISAKLYDWWFNSINYVGCFQYLPSTVLIKAFCQFCQISCLKNIMQLVIKNVLKYLVLINGTFWFVMIFRHLFGAWESIYIGFFLNYYYFNLFLWEKNRKREIYDPKVYFKCWYWKSALLTEIPHDKKHTPTSFCSSFCSFFNEHYFPFSFYLL